MFHPFGRNSFVAFVVSLGLVTGCTAAPASTAPSATATASEESFQGQELVVATFGGTVAKIWQDNVITPFEKKYGVKVTTVEGLSADILTKLRAQKDNPQIDVWVMTDQGAGVAAQEGLVERLDQKTVPNLANLLPQARHDGDFYANYAFAAIGVAYNTDNVKTAPKSWKDLADPTYKTKLLLPDINGATGQSLLILEAYLNGGNLDKIDPGFSTIGALKPSALTFWTSHDQMAQLIVSGQGWIGPWISDRAGIEINKGSPIGFIFPSEGTVLVGSDIGITKGTKHLALAQKYVDFFLAAEQEKATTELAIQLPANKNVTPSSAVGRFVPSGDALKNAINPDWNKASANLDAWTQRWRREITGQ